MLIGSFNYQKPINEPVLQYAKNSPETIELKKSLLKLKSDQIEIPMYIGSKKVKTGKLGIITPPHEIKHILAKYHIGDKKNVLQAITESLKAKSAWENLPWENRANIFLKAADLIATKYRYDLNAATMLGQSKNCYQAEIDSACELIDFLRFNVYYLDQIYKQQPISSPGIHNRLEYRPLEGFVLAITPFNFTAIAANLPTVAAMCGNVVVWKPSDAQIFSAQLCMKILLEAGLPNGVINLIYTDGQSLSEICFNHPDFAGIHFTGSTHVFNEIWKTIGQNISVFKTYPRIVGETGGKDFVVIHPSANVDISVTALIRGAFEYQGQKCSAASRAYIPSNLANAIKTTLIKDMAKIKMGSVEDFSNFVNAVIDERAFNKIVSFIEKIKKDKSAKIICGGNYNKNIGYFIEPTIIETTNPRYITMCEEIFGPVLTIFIYKDTNFEKTLDLVNSTSKYALTGSIISQDRYAIEKATHILRHAAGNFYINDKPTGAVVGQQPFGGARGSGTNDKAGSMLNLYRWLSLRTIKETLVPPINFNYPFLDN
ncbi:MAG: L-glutamate gamma-semialdehyde dehydrogenase [Sediminibacterium sp.]|nr:L-glutamate gamma-semialdehyde dehydrogenase [Sediminibacterium sp.]